MTQQPTPEITLTVAGYPPAKSEAKSIFSQGHPHHSRAIDLLREMKRALADNPRWDRMETRPVGLELAIVETRGQTCQSDATNFLGGAADTLQANRYKGGDVPPDFATVSLPRRPSDSRGSVFRRKRRRSRLSPARLGSARLGRVDIRLKRTIIAPLPPIF